jgi:transketolase
MAYEIVKRPHVENFVKWSKNKPEVVVLSADLTSSCEVGKFRDTYPERFFSFGLGEQNMLGFAGGLAREGFEPWIHTFAVFIYRRPLDQLQMSVAYPNLPVRMVGFLPGITTPGGVTHQAIDDVNVMRGIPNMTILETGDATEVESVLDVAHNVKGPVYVRMLRGEISRIFPRGEVMEFNSARVLNTGTDITIISSGISTEEALRAIPALLNKGISIQHLHVSTLKPFTDPKVMQALQSAKHGVITMENHSIIGGLGSAVAELMAESGIGKKLVRIGLNDTYAHGASLKYLLEKYSLGANKLIVTIENLLGKKLDISAQDLEASRVIDVHSTSKAEAL